MRGVRGGPGFLLALVLVLSACTPEADVPQADPSADVTPALTAEMCAAVLSDPVFKTLGWDAPVETTVAAGRCEGEADGQGLVTMGEVPTPAIGTGDAEAAREAYDEGCAEHTGAEGDVQPSVDWLEAGAMSCARLPVPGVDVGLAEVFVLTADDRVLQLRLTVVEPTPTERLEAGSNRVVDAYVDLATQP